MNIIAPIFLVLAAVGIFYGYVNPNYRGENIPTNIVNLLNERKQYAELLANSNSLIAERNRLVKKNNDLSGSDLERLKKLLPDNIDNVRLIIDIDSIASRYGLNIRNIKISAGALDSERLGPDNSPYGTLTFKFNIIATYDKFKLFIQDLEKSLRVIDIASVSFNSTETGAYDYEISVKTYWIK